MPNALQHTDVCPVPVLQAQLDEQSALIEELGNQIRMLARKVGGVP
jgi:hypothetical protein